MQADVWVWQIIAFHHHLWSSLLLILFIADQKPACVPQECIILRDPDLGSDFLHGKERSLFWPWGHFIIPQRWEYFWKGINFSARVKKNSYSPAELQGGEKVWPVIGRDLGSGSCGRRLGLENEWSQYCILLMTSRIKADSPLFLCIPVFCKGILLLSNISDIIMRLMWASSSPVWI